ncbi:ABC transporter substrate-binding protein [Paenibacillus methanolicus]|uniref:Putative aldouronate transport system substrate-binding protein n=1 Tax=Paenibacillus methanolicus TaxID=582686 RepID=A0A5S5CD98_9BACL|nr:ABC transporter substrate-binding protein [Paenibacillus methanolicus]TYP76482.1 putative aldouronate transport system substrate-binding protein [Paenibacillus methanolicus]
MTNRFKPVLLLILGLMLVLSGCANSNNGKGNEAAGADKGGNTAAPITADPAPVGEEKVSPAGEFPITKEKTTLRVMVMENGAVEDFATNAFTKYLEEKTNIQIDWDIVPGSAAAEKLNLVLAGGDLPDVIMNMWVSNAQQMVYGSQGIIIPLNDLIEKYGKETKRIFAENPLIQEAITAPDGKIYALPSPNDCYHCSMIQKMWVYQPWLDELGLKKPTTTDEFYEMLKAFKTQDPNKNGKADEIPLSGGPKGWETRVDKFLMNAFIYNPANYVYLNNGKADVPFNKPEWKEGLAYLHKLYDEGLLDPQALTQDGAQLRQLGENPDVPILGASGAGYMGELTQDNGASGRWKQYTTLAPLRGPGGLQVAPLGAYHPNGGNFVITKAAKNPEAAFRLADALYDLEMTLRSVVGIPGKQWDWASKDEIGINGKPAIWKRLLPDGQVQNDSWAQTGPSYRSNDMRLGEVNHPEQSLEPILYNETKTNYEPYKASNDLVLPNLFFTSEQSAELADLQKTINDFVDESLARFITGDQDVAKDWQEYVKNLEQMNVKRYLEIYQQAYDAKLASMK